MDWNGYEQTQKISYFQIDDSRSMTATAMLSALQEMAVTHSDHLGYSMDYLTERRKGWAVINWHLVIHRMPKRGEEITLQTWSDSCRRLQATRSFYVLDEVGEKLVDASSRWVYMDFDTRKPSSVTQEMIDKYYSGKAPAIENEKFFLPRESEITGTVVSNRAIVVTRRDTDTNHHVNNVKYLEWAMDDVPDEIYDGMNVQDVRIVYRKECVRGDVVNLKTYVAEGENGREVSTFMTDDQGTLFSEVVTFWA